MKALKIAGLLSLLIAGGCGRIASPGDLLHAPNLANEEQSLYRAVQPFLPAGYQLTTPDQSDQGSAIRLADLDGDGTEELIVSYKKPDTDYEINVLILKQSKGAWQKADQITGSGINLDYLGIKPLTDSSSSDLLLGYEGGGVGLPKELHVYAYSGGKTRSIYQSSYDQIAVGDLIGSGLSQIAVVPPGGDAENSRSRIEIVGVKNGKLGLLSDNRTDGTVLNIRIGRASAKQNGLFAQVLGSTRSGYSILVAWKNGKFANVLSLPSESYDRRAYRENLKLGPPDSDSDLTATENKWWIDYPVDSRDIDGDGITEVVLPNPIPTAESDSASPKLWTDSYYRWDGDREMIFVEDRLWQWGYDLRIPKRWTGFYEVEPPKTENDQESSEMRFLYAPLSENESETTEGENATDIEAPLLTLRQMTTAEWMQLQPMLDSREGRYIVLNGAAQTLPGSPATVTLALLPEGNAGLSGEQAKQYAELMPTEAEVRAMTGIETVEEEGAESDVEKH
ncbi:hypothetical protein CDO73_09180 [Saccharibacillus sp. O23]|uniref:hypothetical protein n=1 Tax=Saccharibacillus sp. O23 TaxID=2009338 RepID=UPI000B4DF884|nr:hypothetical protein [Saccharibacillus sp. O23]OWR30754.1 hypothetical protein CDO73_09180 [Saccharibacillus sp. O23]